MQAAAGVLDANPHDNCWKPPVRTKLTPLLSTLDEADLTSDYDRLNVIAGPWACGASYQDPWYTRSTMLGARIVAKCVDATAERKLRRAGATSVVSPSSIGGVRMAAEVLRPNAIEFLDRMLRDQGDRKMRISDLAITPGGPLVGRTLAETPIRSMGALVLAARRADGEFEYNPSGNLVLAAGMALIVLVGVEDLQRLRRELVIEPAV